MSRVAQLGGELLEEVLLVDAKEDDWLLFRVIALRNASMIHTKQNGSISSNT